MGKKSLALALSAVSTVPFTVAQVAGGSGNIQGILPLITEILGIDVSNPYNAIGILATLGIMNVSVYVILKIGFRKLELLDVVMPGSGHSSGGRNILAILSTLVTISIFGTGAAAGLIAGFQSMFLLGFTFLLIGAGVFIIVGGTGGVLGGGSYMAGKSAKATTKGIKEGAEALDEAGELLQTAESEEREGRERGESGDRDTEHEEEADAEQKLNRVLQILDYVEGDFQEVLEENKNRINDAINDLEEAEEDEEVEEKAEVDIEKRIGRVDIFLEMAVEKIDESGGMDEAALINGTRPYDFGGIDYGGAYGLEAGREDLEMIEKRLNQIVSNIKEEEGFIGEGLQELLEAAQEVVAMHEYTYELKQLLKEAEEDTEFMEKLAQDDQFKDLYSDARDAETHEKEDLEPKMNKIEEEEEQLFEALKKADKLVEKHLSLNSYVIQLLENKVSKEAPTGMSGIIGGWKEVNSQAQDLLRHAESYTADNVADMMGPPDNEGTILYYLEDIGNHLKAIDSELNSEYKKEQEEIQELEQYIDNFSSAGA